MGKTTPEHRAAWRARRIAEGGCVSCREPAVPGKQVCAKHAAKRREYAKAFYERSGVRKPRPCPRCGGEMKLAASKYCVSCSYVFINARRRRGEDAPSFDEIDEVLE